MLVSGALAVTPTASYAAQAVAAARVTPCSSGLVALTFDDGPSSAVTPRLLAILRRNDVSATFFMVGERVSGASATARAVARAGHVVANHTWHHTLMTTQTDEEIRDALLSTDRVLRRAGVVPSKLMRPPYGGIDARVRAAIARTGLVPVLWDIDPEDWMPRSTQAIEDSVIAGLRPHRSNVVLQHDGVGNSANSVAAVPGIIRRARAKGYCFGALGADGRPEPPVPHATMTVTKPREGRDAVIRVRLDQPTTRQSSVLLATSGKSATSADFRSRRVRVRFPVGTTRRTVRIPTRQDRLDEPDESFRVHLRSPRRMTARKLPRNVRIRDDDRPPGVRIADLAVGEPVTGSTTAALRVTLNQTSGRTVRLVLRTRQGTAGAADFTAVRTTLVIPAGRTTTSLRVPILSDDLDEPAETFSVEIIAARNARATRGTATVTITPPPVSPPTEGLSPVLPGPAPEPTGQRPARR
ncbi:hypothetical protein ASG90_06065 [Nocardioides sp. Soil797]|nr:hypothetical protein ASG90_06065 [Nocardioides sp. Soil797]